MRPSAPPGGFWAKVFRPNDLGADLWQSTAPCFRFFGAFSLQQIKNICRGVNGRCLLVVLVKLQRVGGGNYANF